MVMRRETQHGSIFCDQRLPIPFQSGNNGSESRLMLIDEVIEGKKMSAAVDQRFVNTEKERTNDV